MFIFILVSWKMLVTVDNVYKGFLLLFISQLSLRYWSWHFGRVLLVFILLSRTSCAAMVVGDWCIILKCGCLWSDNLAANHYHNRLPRKQFSPLIMPTMLWIETHQPWARFLIQQSPPTMVVQIVLLSESTLSPYKDLQYVVETLRSISNCQL